MLKDVVYIFIVTYYVFVYKKRFSYVFFISFFGNIVRFSQLTTCRPHPLKSVQIGFLIKKVSQCSKTKDKTIFRFLAFEIWSILYSKFLESSKYLTKITVRKTQKKSYLSQKMRNVLKPMKYKFSKYHRSNFACDQIKMRFMRF